MMSSAADSLCKFYKQEMHRERLAVMSTKIRNTKTQHKDIQDWSWHWSMQNTMKGINCPDGRENHRVDHVNDVDITYMEVLPLCLIELA